MVEKGEIAPDDITSSFFASIFVKVSFKTSNFLADINLLDFDLYFIIVLILGI